MNVFLLEDDILQQQRLEQLIREVASENKWPLQDINTTSKPHHLLEMVKNTVGPNLYFLDIEIHGDKHRGLDFSREIRALDSHGVIAFITTHSEFAPITYAYKVSALDFINKEWPVETLKEHIADCFIQLLNLHGNNNDTTHFFFESQNTIFRVPISDIYYFETTDISHKLRLVCKNRLVNFYANLGDIERKNANFYKVHRSFLVNLANIVEFDRSEGQIYFNKETSCYVSRRKISDLTKKFKELGIVITS